MAEDRKVVINLGMTRQDWQNRTEVAELHLETGKAAAGGIRSSATVFWVQGSARTHAFGFGGEGDFGLRVKDNNQARATQKNIDAQHNAIFTPEHVKTLISQVQRHYANAKRITRATLAAV